MILIADSGSTKVHWALVTASGQISEFRTDGINPLFQTCDAMRNSISNQLLPQMAPLLWAGTLTHIFFYGAGCTPEKKVFVKKALETVFKKAEVFVESDMLGAARGLLGHTPGVACILGTGSGSCFYNGETIEWCVPSLGYILGDEGSAAVLGKRLVGDLLKNQLEPTANSQQPTANLKEIFFEEYETSMADIIEKVYRQPFPNRFLAKLSRFCADHIEDERIHALVYDHFVQFIRRNLVQYRSNQPIGFVGSIAYYYRPILEEAMRAEGQPLGTILQDPIPGLIEYHKDVILPTT
ncbi:MAG: ATPase [Paludibacteraceae bacterium]|nr:ATPase [Paludibacteraceae bacterium]